MPQVLHHELHVHLAGCLGAEDLWEIGKDRYRQVEDRLLWYVDEYEKACGRRPDYKQYWEQDNGLDLLRADFEFRERAPFPVFQAHFNLIIALMPIDPSDDTLITRVLLRDQDSGLQYCEYRAFVPPDLQGHKTYYSTLAQACLSADSTQFAPRIALSLSRDNNLFTEQYRALREWQVENKTLAPMIVGIDFCGNEEIDPPKNKAEVFRQIHNDNSSEAHKLAILHHVGESFENHSLMSAIRWVWQAVEMGAHRLGHALAAGVHPEVCEGRINKETSTERLDHLQWMIDKEELVKNFGFAFDVAQVKKEIRQIEDGAYSPRKYDKDYFAEAFLFQDATLEYLAKQKAVVECCPTSNFRIGQIERVDHHPLMRFIRNQVPLVIGSDDPGLFGIRLGDEAELCRELFGLDQAQLHQLESQAKQSKANLLV